MDAKKSIVGEWVGFDKDDVKVSASMSENSRLAFSVGKDKVER